MYFICAYIDRFHNRTFFTQSFHFKSTRAFLFESSCAFRKMNLNTRNDKHGILLLTPRKEYIFFIFLPGSSLRYLSQDYFVSC